MQSGHSYTQRNLKRMKCFYLLVFSLITTIHLQSQSPVFSPAQGNPVLRNFAAQEAWKQALAVEQLTGISPQPAEHNRNLEDCPPDFLYLLVESGREITITLDTFGYGKDLTLPVLTLLNADELQFGDAVLMDSSIILKYNALPGLTGAGVDTVKIGFSQPAGDTIIQVPIHVKRKGRTITSSAIDVEPETIALACFGHLADFPQQTVCSEFLRCQNNYDGNGDQLYHFSSYAYPDTCVVYYASRFPGTDTVCVRICDEWQVCDTFKLPFRIKGDTIKTLPFFDDFSAYRGPYPTAQNWLDRNVFINTTLAKDPPSVGLATFDGLDRRGRVYEIVQGVGDVLTSKPIDLSGFTPNDNVSLRYFVAPKGYGLEPEKEDIFVLEFRNAQRQWIAMDTLEGLGDVAIDFYPPFEFYAVAINDPQFLHPAFQFRFLAHTSPGGEVDMWHLDYVRLGANEGTTSTFPDVAFTQLPTSILKNYTSMPWEHFKANVDGEVQDRLFSHFYNHFDQTTAIGSSNVIIRETTTGTVVAQNFPVLETGPDNNISSKTPNARQRTLPGFDNVKQVLKGIPDAENRNLLTEYHLVVTAQSQDFRSNDTVRTNNLFSNYFAHDDGTAEWQFYIKSAQGGERMATRYRANVDDTLKAVQLLFPRVNGDVQNQVFSLLVWEGSLDSEPIFERELLRPFYASNVLDTLQGFTTYVLDDFLGEPTPVFIPKGDFYIGIEQTSAVAYGIPIGYDLQNHCDCNYYNIFGDWDPFPSFYPGSLMMRPVFGNIKSTPNHTDEVQPSAQVVDIFPNPSTGLLNFSVKKGSHSDYKVFVFNELGQMLAQQPMQPQMHLPFMDGLYFLKIVEEHTGNVFNHKIVLSSGRP